MFKIRNSLGVLVLPVPYQDTISWDKYKQRYGIDLDSIFEIVEKGDDYAIKVKKSCSKMIILAPDSRYLDLESGERIITPIVVPNGTTNEDNQSPENCSLAFVFTPFSGALALSLNIMGDKSVYGEYA